MKIPNKQRRTEVKKITKFEKKNLILKHSYKTASMWMKAIQPFLLWKLNKMFKTRPNLDQFCSKSRFTLGRCAAKPSMVWLVID